jgi:PAS domain S-box-containing protein
MNKNPEIKILLVDDREDNLLSIETVLDGLGYRFYKARSGREALKILLKQQDFSLILMDVQMPELNGFETAAIIYQRERLKDIPIIFITAFNYGEDNIFKGYKTGAVDYIYKPINPELLKLKVSIFIDLYRKNFLLRLQEQELKTMNSELQIEISERVKFEEELKIKNQQLNEAQKMSNLGSWEWDIASSVLTGSSEFYNIYGFHPENNSITLDQFSNAVHPEDRSILINTLSTLSSTNTPADIVYRIFDDNGKIKSINLKGRAVRDVFGTAFKIFGTSQDITFLRQTEEQLRILYILEKCLNEIYVFDAKTFSFEYVNEDACRNLGYTQQEMFDLTPFDILPETFKDNFKDVTSPVIGKDKEKVVFETTHKRKDGTSYAVEVHLQLIEKIDSPVFLAITIDITERLKAEEKIKASLKEKEILLKEIHHRVKNNLQVISSLLNLQSYYINDEHSRSIFIESKNRVISMALIHEKLYRYNNLSKINFNEYLEDLAKNLIVSYKTKKHVINLNINNKSEVLLDIGTSIPLGLCVNELLTNSIKYAFPDERDGEIKIELFSEENKLHLSISDNGIGMKKEIDFQNLQSLGMQLIHTLIDQLNGKIEINQNGCTEFKIAVPLTVTESLADKV